jgi:predicted DNA-binding transcriptional regulator AlpA
MSHARLMSGPQVYAEVGVSRWTWARWVASGKAPAPVANLPGQPKWRRVDVERFIDGTFKPSGRSYFGKVRRAHDDQAVAIAGVEGR